MAHDDDYDQLAFESLIPEGSMLNSRASGFEPPEAGMQFTDGDPDDDEDETAGMLYGAERNPTGRPSTLTLIPTSTTDPDRPRTLAAGWDRRTRTLTVVFRDGSVWNFYEVDGNLWTRFASAISKGAFIYTYLDHTRGARSQDLNGPASGNDARVRAVVDWARARQESRQGVQHGQGEGYFGQDAASRRRARAVAHVETKKAGGTSKYRDVGHALGYKAGNLGGTGRKRMARDLDAAVAAFYKNKGRMNPGA